jgi:hypothetical protein
MSGSVELVTPVVPASARLDSVKIKKSSAGEAPIEDSKPKILDVEIGIKLRDKLRVRLIESDESRRELHQKP